MRWVRRHIRWLAPVLASTFVAFGVFWWGWLPGKVLRRAERELVRRTGLSARIGDVDMSLRGAVLEGVHLTTPGGPIAVTLDEVGVRVGIFGALRGEPEVEYVQVRGARVVVDLGHESAGRVLAGLRRGGTSTGAPPSASASGAAGSRRTPVLEVQDLAVSVRDAHGDLGRANGLSIRFDGGARVAVRRLELGAEGGDRVVLERAFVAVERGPHEVLRLTRLVSERGEVVWAAPVEEGAVAPAADRIPPLATRLHDALSKVSDDAAVPTNAEAEGDPHEDTASVGVLARLSPDVRIDLGDLTFDGRAPDGTATTIRFTELLLGRADDGRLHTIGEGDGGESGTARWNLVFDPATRRAEGDLRFDALPMGFVAPLVPFVPFHPTPDGRLSADLRLRVTPESNVEIEGRVAVTHAALESRRIADRPVTGIAVALEGTGVWHPAEKRLVWSSGHLRSGEVDLQMRGELAITDDAYRVRFEGTLPPTECQSVIEAIPRDVLGPVASFQLAGTIGGRALVRVDSRDLDATEVEIHVADGCEFIAVPAMAEIYRFDGPFAHQVVEPDGTVFTMTTGPGTASWAPFASIHRNVVSAVLSHEDASFYAHSGFAPWAIREALVRNLTAGAFRYGASTISMQLTKNLFLRREKTLVRKVQEVFLTWWLERALEKHRILELYLNVIEYGPGLYGIRNATRHYFGREPSDVSPAEAAFLANVLPSPKLYGGMYAAGAPSESMRNRMAQFLRHMHSRGRLGAEALAHGLAEIPVMRFQREGDPPPPPRVLPGDPAAASYDDATDAPADDDEWSVPDDG